MGKGRLFLWAVTSALAGFLFGFDTVVISGAEKQIQDIWSLSGSMHGWALSSALWGTVLGALCGGFPTSRWGRRKTLIFNGILYFVSAVGSGIAWDVWSFIVFRFIGGVGVGISTIAAPLFIAEISPPRDRGKLAGLFQFNIVFGILVAYLSNYIIGNLCSVETAWRWMLGVEALPALVYTVMCFTLPESPRWLIVDAKKNAEGIEVFRKVNPGMSEQEIQELAASVEASAAAGTERTSKFWTKRLCCPILFAFLIAAFNQLSGINIILYFAPRLLSLSGLDNALAASISLGVTNLIFTFVGLHPEPGRLRDRFFQLLRTESGLRRDRHRRRRRTGDAHRPRRRLCRPRRPRARPRRICRRPQSVGRKHGAGALQGRTRVDSRRTAAR